MVGTAYSHDRPPVEHRVLGLDRRSFPGAIFVGIVFLVFTVVIPRIDAAIPWDDPVVAGDELALTGKLSFTPAVGWNIEQGHRLAPDGTVAQSGDATLTGAGVQVDVVTGAFDGTPKALLEQAEKVTAATVDPAFRVNGAPTTTRTDSGESGVLQHYGSVDEDGVIAAFVIDGTGVKITAHGSPAQMQAATQQISDMLASLRALDTEDAS